MENFFDIVKEDPFKEELLQQYLDDRIIIINDQIDDQMLFSVVLRIMQWNKEDRDIPVDKRNPIWLFMQTVGGSSIYGFNVVDAIISSQTPVYAVCFALCASMGFHIFISAKKRFAFKHSVLLIHDGELSVNNSTSKAKDTMKFFDQLEERTKEHVIQHTSISSEKYDEIYEKEYYMYADAEGKELGCVDYIINEDVQLDEILKNERK